MTLPSDTARSWVDIDLGALVANARTIAEASGTRLLPMVKANGYGLGAARVAGALEALDPWGYGVATVDEGVALRAAGIQRPILVVSPLSPETLEPIEEHGFRPAIGDQEMLRCWLARSTSPFHLEIDSGMSRAGFRWDDDAALAAAREAVATAAGWEGIFTHFHSADRDAESASVQWRRFQAVVGGLPGRQVLVHAANSAASFQRRVRGRHGAAGHLPVRRRGGRACAAAPDGRGAPGPRPGGSPSGRRGVCQLRGRVVRVAADHRRHARRRLCRWGPPGCRSQRGRRHEWSSCGAARCPSSGGSRWTRPWWRWTTARSRWATWRPSSAGSSRSTSRRPPPGRSPTSC